MTWMAMVVAVAAATIAPPATAETPPATTVDVVSASPRLRPGYAIGRFYYYGDDSGLSVATAAASIEQPVSRHFSLTGQVVVDRIDVERATETHMDMGGQITGHVHGIDAVTNASVTVTGGGHLEKSRVEGTTSVIYDRELASGAPMRWQAIVRVGVEHDYHSYSGRLRMTTALFERNTIVSAFVGYGYDTIEPTEAPPGESNLWPASHDRWFGAATVNQVMGRRWLLSAGGALSRQSGMLSNPYRRALIRTTLFPEHLPGDRIRATGFVGASVYLGWETALSLQQGVYVDSWDVAAFIPDVALTRTLGESVLVSLGYRYYGQTAASFYAPTYADLLDIRTGDIRLGQIRNHQPRMEISWNPLSGERRWSLTLGANYALSMLEYTQINRRVVGHIVGATIGAGY